MPEPFLLLLDQQQLMDHAAVAQGEQRERDDKGDGDVQVEAIDREVDRVRAETRVGQLDEPVAVGVIENVAAVQRG